LRFDPQRPLPVATIAIVATCVAVWLLQLLRGVPLMNAPVSTVVDWGGSLPLYVLTGEPWRLVTALFLHVDMVHLAINMIVFSLTAPHLERAFGPLRMVAIFLVGGVLANAGYAAWAAVNSGPADFGRLLSVLAGASGGLMALQGALLVPSLLAALGHEPYATMLGGRVDRNLLWTIAINIGICFAIPHWDPTVNITGALAGLVVGGLVLAAPHRGDTATNLLRFAAVGLLVAACVGGLARSGDRDFLVELRSQYDAWRSTHP
jgi:rhomboid protease GluP